MEEGGIDPGLAGLNAKPLSIFFYHFLAFKEQLAGQKKDTQGNANQRRDDLIQNSG